MCTLYTRPKFMTISCAFHVFQFWANGNCSRMPRMRESDLHCHIAIFVNSERTRASAAMQFRLNSCITLHYSVFVFFCCACLNTALNTLFYCCCCCHISCTYRHRFCWSRKIKNVLRPFAIFFGQCLDGWKPILYIVSPSSRVLYASITVASATQSN